MAATLQSDRTEPAEGDALSAVHDALRERAALLVQHRGGVEVAMLEPGNSLVVGRDAPSSLRLADSTLSRAHARLTLVGDRVRVEDLGSTNGTWIGGQRITSVDVTAGTELKLGSVIARVHLFARDDGAAPHGAAGGRAPGGDALIGRATAGVFETAARVADSRLSVLIQGETGSGKEVLARYMHARSPRAGRPFLAVNCGAIPAQLVESTLFGHERGAFTGAIQQHKGVFEAAHGGTVLLDEIGELSPPAQAALLLVLENGRFCRVGSTREIAVDARVLAASHRDLARMVAAGSFRADLYYRLQGTVLRLPPLRERRDEIAPLVERLVERANAQHGRKVAGVAADALLALAAYDWPGNVRELRNAVDQAVVIARGSVVTLDDLPAAVRETAGSAGGSAVILDDPPAAEAAGEEGEGEGGELRAQVDQYEARLITEALERSGYRRAEAARRLGLPLRTLARKIKQLGIKEPK